MVGCTTFTSHEGVKEELEWKPVFILQYGCQNVCIIKMEVMRELIVLICVSYIGILVIMGTGFAMLFMRHEEDFHICSLMYTD